ncbi:hypothetical protein COL516b_002815 [Colletotrichum fioriniae]|nr:uncharacterized protein COL516b_002815 [Colletotrichum fioriniae]KAJ0309568.1 hypothetical protein COL516b_002815 [Colletotrichum fioriniae]
MDVATLVAQMNEALASIHSTIEGLSTSAAESDTKLDELEQKRDMTLAELKAAYEKEREELAAVHQKELEDIAEQRRKEDEEREARRRREDEELAARKAKEDEEKQGTFDTTTRNIEDEMDDLMDSIEEETAKTISEGEAKLAELEAKRTELNRMIEEQMKAAVPPVPTRKRARTGRRSGAVPSAEPSPLPPPETPAEPVAGDKSVDEEKPAENGVAPEEKAEDTAPAPPADAPGEEDKTPEGDNSQPQPEEPVAEKSLEEATSTEEAQPAGEEAASAPEAEAEAEKAPEDEPVAEAAAPEEAPEPAPTEDDKEEPAESAVVPEDSQESAPADSEEAPIEPPAEAEDAAGDDEKHDAIEVRGLAVETPETAPVEGASAAEEPAPKEPATEEPAAEEPAAAAEPTTADQSDDTPPPEDPLDEPSTREVPAAGEEAPTADEAPSAEDTPAAEEPATEEPAVKEDTVADQAPAVEETPAVEEAPAAVDAPAEDTPATTEEPAEEPSTKEPTKEDPAVEETPVEDAPAEDKEALEEAAAEEGTVVDEAPVAEESAVEAASTKEAPIDGAPTEATPAEETQAEEAPVEDAPTEEVPAEEALGEEAAATKALAAEEPPADDLPLDDAPAPEEASTEGTPAAEAASEEPAADEEAPAVEASAEESAKEDVAADEASPEESPIEEVSDEAQAAPNAPEDDGSKVLPLAEDVPTEEATAEEAAPGAEPEDSATAEKAKASEDSISAEEPAATKADVPSQDDAPTEPVESTEEANKSPEEETTPAEAASHESAPDASEDAADPEEVVAKDAPADETAPESSPESVEDDTPKQADGEAEDTGADEGPGDRSLPEFSMKAVEDDSVVEEAPVVDSSNPVEEEAAPEADQAEEDASPEIDSKAVDAEPSQEEPTSQEKDAPPQTEKAASNEDSAAEEPAQEKAISPEDADPVEAATTSAEDVAAETADPIEELLKDTSVTEDAKDPETPLDAAPAEEEKEAHAQDATIAAIGETSTTEKSALEGEAPAADDAPSHDEMPGSEEIESGQTPPIEETSADGASTEPAPIVEADSAEDKPEPEADAPAPEQVADEVTSNTATVQPAVDEQVAEEDPVEAAAVDDSEIAKDAAPTEAADEPTDSDHAVPEAAAAEDQPTAESEQPAAQDTTAGHDEASVEEDGETARASLEDEPTKENITDEEEAPDEEPSSEAPATGEVEIQDANEDQAQEVTAPVTDADTVVAKEIDEPAASPEEDLATAQPDPEEIQAEVSEAPPTTHEEEEPEPTTASKDLDDGDSEHRDAPNTPEEQLAGGVVDAAENDSTAGPSDATADAPADSELTEAVAVDVVEAQAPESEGHVESEKVEVDSTPAEHGAEGEAPAAPVDESVAIEADESVGDALADTEETQPSAADADKAWSEHAEASLLSAKEAAPLADSPEPIEEEATSTAGDEAPTADISGQHDSVEETPAVSGDVKQDEQDKDLEDSQIVVSQTTAAPETIAHGDEGDVDVQERSVSLEEPRSAPAEVHDVSQSQDHHGQDDDDDEHDAAMMASPGHEVDVENDAIQHDSDHGEFEVVEAPHDEAGSDEADQSRGPDLSMITEHTEPAASAAGDSSGLATKTDDGFHPESLSRNVSEAPDAAIESSHMTEPTGMATDDSHVQDQQQESSAPSTRFFDGHFGTRQVHFNEDEEDNDDSSPVLSVRDEDSDADEPAETSYNPFTRARAGSTAHAQPTFHSQDIPYNPFALQTVVEEEPPRETTNPFARSPSRGPQEDLTNPFARNTPASGADFLRSASALSNHQPSSPEETFARSPSAQGLRRDSVSSNNPFARSTTPVDRSFSPALSTPGRQRAPSNPFARSTTPQQSYALAEDSDSEDEEAMMAAESTYKNLFPVNQSPEAANDGFASAAQSIERRQPTPQVPESMYTNPFARNTTSDQSFLPTASALGQAQPDTPYNPFGARSSTVGGDVDESMFDQGYPSAAGGQDFVGEGVMDPSQQFVQENSPLSARHLAPVTLDSIQERYNSELEDMDSDSEEPESLTTSQQLPASQHRAPPPLPSIAERSRQGFDDSSEEEEDWDARAPQPSQINTLLTSSPYRTSPPPPPPPRISSSQGHYAQEVEDSSEDDGDIFHAQSPARLNPLSSSQHRATPPPPPPPRAPSSQGHYAQQQLEDSSEEEQADWDDAFEPAQPSTFPASQFGSTPPRPPPIPPPGAPSSLSQSRYNVEDSDEEDQGVLPSAATQSNLLPSALSPSGYRATPPPPPPPRAPSSQGFYHQEQADSSEDEHPFSHDIARPGQFPISSSSQFRATPPPPPPPRVASSQGQYRQEIEEDSSDEQDEDAWDSNAARPGQIPNLSTSQFKATPPPPPPPRTSSALGRYRQELEDSDSEENEEAWEANRYGQTTSMMGASNLMGTNQMGVDSMRSASPLGASPMRAASPLQSTSPLATNPMRASSPLASTSPIRSASPVAQSNPMESAFRDSVPATSSQGLPSHQREEGGEESDDSWENIGKRGGDEISPVDERFSTAMPTPQLRIDSYEQQWPNASNDQISTASTYLQPAGPGDFTDSDSQEYATPLASAGFSASSQYTQGAMGSPRHPDSTGNKDIYDQTYNRGGAMSPYGQTHETSLADELAQEDDSDDDSEYEHSEAPAFLTQIGTAQQLQQQQQQTSNEPVLTQVIDSFDSDEDDGPRTAVMQPAEHPTQYASSRFGASTWRDELRSPTMFGATRHSRSGSLLREEVQKSVHQEATAGYSSPLRSAYEPDTQVEGSYGGQQAQMHGQDVYGQQSAEYHAQDALAQQQYGQAQFDHDQFETQPYGQAQLQPQYGQATSWQPGVQVPEIQAEEEHEQTTPQLAPQQSEQAPDISPLALRQEESPATPSSSQGTPSRGLAFSRHNPDRPQTPPTMQAEGDFDPELMVPRDVTNVPWHARNDSVPHSMRSQSTLDSVASSPIHSALHADKHEPVIRDSWPASVHHLTRPRNDSSLTDREEYDPFRDSEEAAKAARGPSGSVGSSSDSPPRNAATTNNNSPGSLISRMRGIFENNQAKQEPASPVRSRPVSGVFHPVRRSKPGGGDDFEDRGYERKAGFLNEAEDEVDEQSALLRSSAGGLEAN